MKAPEITKEGENEFHDLLFWIKSDTAEPNESRVIEASGKYHGKNVGFQIVILPTWNKQANTLVSPTQPKDNKQPQDEAYIQASYRVVGQRAKHKLKKGIFLKKNDITQTSEDMR